MRVPDLAAYREPFKAAVLKHIREALGEGEWTRLRAMAADHGRYVDPSEAPDLEASPDHLLADTVAEDSLTVRKMLVPKFKAVAIAEIAGHPVYYVEGRGIYLWGLGPDSYPTLSFWATWPAYPPGW